MVRFRRFVIDEAVGRLDVVHDLARLIWEHSDDAQPLAAARGVMEAIQDHPDEASRYIAWHDQRSGLAPRPDHQPPVRWDLEHSHGVSGFFPSRSRSFYGGERYDWAGGATWGQAAAGGLAWGDGPQWGPMVVAYVRATNPTAPDDPQPPALQVPLTVWRVVHLPLVTGNP